MDTRELANGNYEFGYLFASKYFSKGKKII